MSEKKKGSSHRITKKELEELLKKEREERQKLEERVKELEDKYLRALADLENYKKLVRKETMLVREQAVADVLRQILPVLDNFERALEAAKNDADRESLLKGVEMIYRQLQETLRSCGVEPFSSVGEPFDPSVHEALGVICTEEHPPDTVVEEHEKGYTLRGKLLRPARVLVSTRKEGEGHAREEKERENNRD